MQRVITDLAVVDLDGPQPVLRGTAPGVDLAEVQECTGVDLAVAEDLVRHTM